MKQYIISSVVLLILDFLWIGLYMGKKYTKEVPKIQGSDMDPKVIYAIFAYLLMVIGLNIFVVPNISKENRLMDSLKYGFTFGIVMYGVYDFTAATVFKDWNIQLALVDVMWGGFVYFMAAYIGSFFA